MDIEDFSSKAVAVFSVILRLFCCVATGLFAYSVADSHNLIKAITAAFGMAFLIGSVSVYRLLTDNELTNTAALAFGLMVTFACGLMMWPLFVS